MKIQETGIEGLDTIMEISMELPEWFSPNGLKYIQMDMNYQKALIASVGNIDMGFLSYFTYEGVGYLAWMGVRPKFQNQGIGIALFESFKNEMRELGITTLQVQTLGGDVDYQPYEQTRNFYKKVGFKDYKTEISDNPECPERLTLRMNI
jgi:GNAT superfamily N-acetyltransferase